MSEGRGMTWWQMLKPGWRSGANAAAFIAVSGLIMFVWPWAAFAILALHLIVSELFLGAQAAAIKEIQTSWEEPQGDRTSAREGGE